MTICKVAFINPFWPQIDNKSCLRSMASLAGKKTWPLTAANLQPVSPETYLPKISLVWRCAGNNGMFAYLLGKQTAFSWSGSTLSTGAVVQWGHHRAAGLPSPQPWSRAGVGQPSPGHPSSLWGQGQTEARLGQDISWWVGAGSGSVTGKGRAVWSWRPAELGTWHPGNAWRGWAGVVRAGGALGALPRSLSITMNTKTPIWTTVIFSAIVFVVNGSQNAVKSDIVLHLKS